VGFSGPLDFENMMHDVGIFSNRNPAGVGLLRKDPGFCRMPVLEVNKANGRGLDADRPLSQNDPSRWMLLGLFNQLLRKDRAMALLLSRDDVVSLPSMKALVFDTAADVRGSFAAEMSTLFKSDDLAIRDMSTALAVFQAAQTAVARMDCPF
jgi:hypothetical protein